MLLFQHINFGFKFIFGATLYSLSVLKIRIMFMLLKNNWKKVAVLTPISAYGFYSLSSHMEETAHMRKLCNEILAKEDINVSPRKLLVVINPAANKKKTEKLFKKYCEPILHLGGYSVTIMKTNYVGHAKSYIENLSHLPDAIVVAGGQGTSCEVVTGLLRRAETPCPLLILPLGRTQKEELPANSLIGNSNYVKLLSKCALSLIQYKTHFEPVIRYDVIDEEKKSKPTYGLNKFSWGLVRDISVKKDNYWYFGSLRKYAVILFNAFSNNLNLAFGTNYAYTPPCQGCNNCVMVNVTNKNSSFMQRLVTSNKKDNNSKLNITNESCSQRIQGFVETCQVDIACKKNSENFYELETEFKEIMSPGIELLQHSNNIVNGTMDKSLAIRSRTLELYPCDNKENNSYFGIDGEEFSARAIKVSLIQNAIRVFD